MSLIDVSPVLETFPTVVVVQLAGVQPEIVPENRQLSLIVGIGLTACALAFIHKPTVADKKMTLASLIALFLSEFI